MRYVKRGLIYRLFGRVAEYAIGAPIEVTVVYGSDGNVIEKNVDWTRAYRWREDNPNATKPGPNCNDMYTIILREHNQYLPIKYSICCDRCKMNGPMCLTQENARAAWNEFIKHS